jgi:hypothetical protein
MQSAARATEPNFDAEQSREESDPDYLVWDVQHSLEHAMSAVAAHYRDSTGPISTAQRDELLSAVARAHLGAIKHLPKSYRRDQIDAGMQALAGQVMVWAETRERSAQRPQHVLADLDAYARMFRNDLHNISLREEIDRRDWHRRDAEIQKLLRPDDGSEAIGA